MGKLNAGLAAWIAAHRGKSKPIKAVNQTTNNLNPTPRNGKVPGDMGNIGTGKKAALKRLGFKRMPA